MSLSQAVAMPLEKDRNSFWMDWKCDAKENRAFQAIEGFSSKMVVKNTGSTSQGLSLIKHINVLLTTEPFSNWNIFFQSVCGGS